MPVSVRTLRIPGELAAAVTNAAQALGISENAYITRAITAQIMGDRNLVDTRRRAQRVEQRVVREVAGA